MFQAPRDRALLALLGELKTRNYCFVPPSNTTYRQVLKGFGQRPAASVRDVLGWSLPFTPGSIAPEVEGLLLEAGVLEECANGYRSIIRVASLGETLFVHSAFPTRAVDSVFLGPDSYRFAEFIANELRSGVAIETVADVGTGAGVGGIVAARLTSPARVHLSDINPAAVRLAKINAAFAGASVVVHEAPGLSAISEDVDLIVCNPPFIANGGRIYSDGGGMFGTELSLQWTTEAIHRLRAGGRLLLYTGSAIVGGEDPLRSALIEEADAGDCTLHYRELDPDIFSGQLSRPEYAGVERIAAVGAVITRG